MGGCGRQSSSEAIEENVGARVREREEHAGFRVVRWAAPRDDCPHPRGGGSPAPARREVAFEGEQCEQCEAAEQHASEGEGARACDCGPGAGGARARLVALPDGRLPRRLRTAARAHPPHKDHHWSCSLDALRLLLLQGARQRRAREEHRVLRKLHRAHHSIDLIPVLLYILVLPVAPLLVVIVSSAFNAGVRFSSQSFGLSNRRVFGILYTLYSTLLVH